MHISSTRLTAGAILLALLSLSSFAAAPKVGVLLKGRSAFWTTVEAGATEAGKTLGAEVIVKAPPSETDIAAQIQLLSALAAQGVEAIVIAPANKEVLAASVAALAAKGIKIVAIDTPLEGNAAVFVGTNHRAAGEAAGRLLATLTGDADEVGFLKHAQNNTATEQREAGALEQLRTLHPKVTVHGDVYASTEAGVEAERAQLLLDKHPGIKAVLASGTPGTLAMMKLLQKKQPAGSIKLVGFGFNLNDDVAAALSAGTLHGWVAQLPREIGAKGVQSAVALLKGEPVPPVVNTDFVVITKDNLKDAKVQALLGN